MRSDGERLVLGASRLRFRASCKGYGLPKAVRYNTPTAAPAVAALRYPAIAARTLAGHASADSLPAGHTRALSVHSSSRPPSQCRVNAGGPRSADPRSRAHRAAPTLRKVAAAVTANARR